MYHYLIYCAFEDPVTTRCALVMLVNSYNRDPTYDEMLRDFINHMKPHYTQEDFNKRRCFILGRSRISYLDKEAWSGKS